MFYLILLALIIFLLWPFLKIAFRMYSFRKQMNGMFDRTHTRQYQQRTDGRSKSPFRTHRKKIDPSIGEYVEFEEIDSTITKDDTSEPQNEVKYQLRQQVSDAEWEEIK